MKAPLRSASARSSFAALLSLASAAGLGAGLMACSANVGADPNAPVGQHLAVVDVRIEQSADGNVAKVDASARFAAVKDAATTADAVDLLGLNYPQLSIGSCSVVQADVAASPRPVRVDLRDLSPVSLVLKGDDATLLRLEPRAFPDVAGLVSGVVFATPADSLLGRDAQLVTVNVANGSIADLAIPSLPARVQLVDAIAAGDAWSLDARGFDVQVDPIEKLSTDDRFALDVVRDGVVRAHCGVDEAGHVHVDPIALGGVGEATLIVRAERRLLRDDPALGRVDARLERDLPLKLVIHE